MILDLQNSKGSEFLEYTDTPLAANAVYTSSGHARNGCQYVTGLCKADQDGYIRVELSPDGSLWIGDTSETYVANDPMNFAVPIFTAPFFRVVFINGSVAQTSFYLYIYRTSV